MPMERRTFIRQSLALVAALTAPGYAWAQSAGASAAYPARPVQLIVGFPRGGPNDILARLIADWLTQRLGQPFVVDNRAGSSGNIATEAVVRAAPDGYTLLLAGPANAIGASLSDKLPFVFLTDIAAVGGITREPLVLLVHPSVAARDARELIALAKSRPGALTMASTGIGSSPHVSGELFRIMASPDKPLDLPVVHYAGGGPALEAMIEGAAQVMFEPMSAAIEPVRKGQLRALAVTSAQRSKALPDIIALGDVVAGYEASAATGIGVPRNTPADIIATLNAALNAAFVDPTMAARLADTGGAPLPGTPADFARVLADETEKWGRVVRASIRKP